MVAEKQKRYCISTAQRFTRDTNAPTAEVFHNTEVTVFLGVETARNPDYFLGVVEYMRTDMCIFAITYRKIYTSLLARL